MSDKNISVQVGPNFLGLLAIVFITLKLTGYITWSWWWVLAPLWGGAVLFLAIVVIFVLVANIVGWFK
jgi:hypothetical protein